MNLPVQDQICELLAPWSIYGSSIAYRLLFWDVMGRFQLALNRYAVFIELILLGFVHRSQVAHGLETLVWGFQCQWVVRE